MSTGIFMPMTNVYMTYHTMVELMKQTQVQV